MALPRLHLFEWEDQSWFPPLWRGYMTDYLHAVERKFGMHRAAKPLLESALEESGAERIVDLCSGSGGPLLAILDEWREEGAAVPATLTDLYPHPSPSADLVYYPEPVDARAVPASLSGLRTLFNGLHHFRPAEARAVLADAVRAGEPIAVFEVADRSVPAILPLVFVPLAMLLLTPTIRPFRWSRLLWTYLVPVLPAAILWDGVVSYLRAYRPEELNEAAEAVGREKYRWKSGYATAEGVPGRTTYLIGMAKS